MEAYRRESMNSNVFFQPFVGKDYANGGIFGKRVMILGESHYCDEGCVDCGDCRLHRECMTFTQHVLGDYLDEGKERQNWMRTFLKFERSLVGELTDQAMRLKIWNSVIFFNYLQVAMGGPRQAGTDEQYRQAYAAFFEVIDKYQPEYIIVWGKRLWNNLPGDDWRHENASGVHWVDSNDIEVEGTWVPNGFYIMPGTKFVKVLVVNHPSVGYSWDYWHRVIQRFLK